MTKHRNSWHSIYIYIYMNCLISGIVNTQYYKLQTHTFMVINYRRTFHFYNLDLIINKNESALVFFQCRNFHKPIKR